MFKQTEQLTELSLNNDGVLLITKNGYILVFDKDAELRTAIDKNYKAADFVRKSNINNRDKFTAVWIGPTIKYITVLKESNGTIEIHTGDDKNGENIRIVIK